MSIDVRQRQEPLRERYKRVPADALIIDKAVTQGGVDTDAFHGYFAPGSQDYGIVHSASIRRWEATTIYRIRAISLCRVGDLPRFDNSDYRQPPGRHVDQAERYGYGPG